MKFDSARQVDSICYQLRYADYIRALNRARINKLFNGCAPYSQTEVDDNGININVNDLSGPVVAHDARSQFYQAFLKPGNYFKCTTDSGPVHKRQAWSAIVTTEINKRMKRSIPYFECFRSKFALDVLHGIAPSAFRDDQCWCPEPMGVEDVMIPSNTLLTMVNLPFFAIHRSFTAPELIKLTSGKNVDKAWNIPMVKDCLKWVDSQSSSLMSTNWATVWSPEKTEERLKGDGNVYTADAVPTVDCWDFYYWNDDDKVQGWNRRIIIDSWSSPSLLGTTFDSERRSGEIFDQNDFLYNPKDRKFATNREQIINWQFADLSAVAPFHYHTVRSLGFLLYSVCHLQNRLRCKFNEAIFEQLMVIFRVKSQEDFQRALKVDMFNKGFIDESLEFVKAGDRYQINTQLAELGLNENRMLINQNSSSYTANPSNGGSSDRKEKTATQFVGEMQSMTQLVSAGLLQAYMYQKPEYREIFRRFIKKDSKDVDCQTFQAACLQKGVSEKVLYCPEYWEQEPEQVLGAGNKTLEMAITQQLMQYRNLYDPEPQRQILRDVTLAITDDAARANALVPETKQKVTDSVHDAQLATGVLMQGLPLSIKTGMNHIEYVETLLSNLQLIVQKAAKNGGMATGDQIVGMDAIGQHIAQHIGIIAQDSNEKQRVKAYGDALGKMMNEVKAFAQRLMEQQKNAQNGNKLDPETAAKIEAIKVTADAKAANTRESHAQRTAQRQIQFEMEQQQKQQEFEAEIRRDLGTGKTSHEMQLAEQESGHGMALAQRKSDLETVAARHDAMIKEAQARHDMDLKQQAAEHKRDIDEKNAEHKRKMMAKSAKSKPTKA